MLENLLAEQVRARRMVLLVSDPPYGISLDSKWREAGERHLSGGLRGVPDDLKLCGVGEALTRARREPDIT